MGASECLNAAQLDCAATPLACFPGPAEEMVQYSARVRPPSSTTELRIHWSRHVEVYKSQ